MIIENDPWLHEPNLVSFTMEGLPCVLCRNLSSMVFFGYVGVPKEHFRYDLCQGIMKGDDHFKVHGGITYSSAETPVAVHIDGDFWWLGFDCGHLNYDYVPNFPVSTVGPKNYKTIQFAMTEIIGLANQIADPILPIYEKVL